MYQELSNCVSLTKVDTAQITCKVREMMMMMMITLFNLG